MNDERCYELLGLKGEASHEEIKAAYRDMAKVWHPDRFAHDPKLQTKAQERLKEINEAYQRLTSPRPARGRTRPDANGAHDWYDTGYSHDDRGARATHQARTPNHARTRYDAPPAVVIIRQDSPRRPVVSVFAVAAVVALAAFFAASRLFVNPTSGKDNSAAASSPSNGGVTAQYDASELSSASDQKERKSSVRQKAADADSSANASDPFAPTRALPTVTRTIDPTTGLLATRSCPTRMLMTYPAGSEPQSSCAAEHAPKPSAPRNAAPAQTQPERAQGADGSPSPAAEAKGKSRLKSVVSTLASPDKWLGKKKDKTPARP